MNFSLYSWLYYLGICILSITGIFADTHVVYAEIYQYTDNQGIIHFTDNPQNIPESIRNKSKREEPSSLSSQDKKIINELMKRGAVERDLQFAGPEEVKKGVTFFRESLREELVDPEELDKPLDPRLVSPDGAISLFRAALRSGNVRDLKACVTNSFWKTNATEYVAMGKQKMAEMEKEVFSRAEIKMVEQNDTEAKYDLVRPEGGKRMSYPIRVINVFGNWKISVF